MSGRVGAVVGFAALAAFSSYHWFELLAEPPPWRWAACLGIAMATVVALLAVARFARGIGANLLAVAVLAASLVAGLLAIGVPARFLAPGEWGELWNRLAEGLAGVSELELPYAEGAEWTRLGILLAAPLALGLAAALAFWPAAGASRWPRLGALALLVLLYGVAVSWESPAGELARGLGLLASIAAFLWLGSIPRRGALAAAAAVAVAGLVALPAAARVDTRGPLIDYTSWKLFGEKRTASFDWDHSYGPLDWPQRGTEMFRVRGVGRPQYWKAEVLEEFDGAAWARGVPSGIVPSAARAVIGTGAAPLLRRRDWIESFEVTVRGLRSPQLVTTGTTRAVDGLEGVVPGPDGTAPVPQGLTDGDTYSVSAYAPDPSAERLRRVGDRRYPRRQERYTSMLLPQLPEGLEGPAAPVATLGLVTLPVRGGAPAPDRMRTAREAIAGTPYERVRSLARRVTEDADGPYEAVLAIKRHLIENYDYRQDVPEHRDPLPAFLFRDRAGYCQQFSGAMALMLRLIGIPSRVATGFAPGLPEPDVEGSYIVRDTDAHSWVEVWFPRVGWVTVDPTPADAPARTETLAGAAAASGPDRGLGRAFEIEESSQAGPIDVAARSGREERSPLGVAAAFLALGVMGLLGEGYRRRRARLLAPSGAAGQLHELALAARLVPGGGGPGLTLRGIEQRFADVLGADAAAYPAALRANRYRRGRPRRPGPGERRRLRRALGRGRGIRGRWRALRAIPPGGPGGSASGV